MEGSLSHLPDGAMWLLVGVPHGTSSGFVFPIMSQLQQVISSSYGGLLRCRSYHWKAIDELFSMVQTSSNFE